VQCGCFGRRERVVGWGLLLEDLVLLSAVLALVLLEDRWIGMTSPSVLLLGGLRGGSAESLGACLVVAGCYFGFIRWLPAYMSKTRTTASKRLGNAGRNT
jgi:hypothetical protein